MIALAVAGSVLALLVFAPYSWSGGGGPPGNRYFMSLYPALLFLTPMGFFVIWAGWTEPLGVMLLAMLLYAIVIERR